MKSYWGGTLPVLDGTAYDKLCLAVKSGDIGAYISNREYQTICPGDKNSVPYVDYRTMLSAINQYLEEHPDSEPLFATAFLEEIMTCPHENALITLIEMIFIFAYASKKGFFTGALVAEMANQIEQMSDKLENHHVDGLGYEYCRKKLQYIDTLVYPLFGIHLIK